MPKALPAKNGQSSCDAVQQTFNINIDHRFPITNAQFLEF
jgi:hypothetical protein